MGGVHICKLVGELNHLLLTDVSSKSLVLLLRISDEWVSWERLKLLKYETTDLRGALFFLAESRQLDPDVNIFSLKNMSSRKYVVSVGPQTGGSWGRPLHHKNKLSHS